MACTPYALALERLQPAVDGILWIEPRLPLDLALLARALAPGAPFAAAAIDPANRFHAALAELAHENSQHAAFSRLPALARALSLSGFTDIEVEDSVGELRVLPTQEWLFRHTAMPAFAAGPPADRARLARALAARLKDLWRGDAFRVPVSVRFVYARKRRIAS